MADEEKPDFSDVEFGSSSTLPTPEPAEQTYTIVAGDSQIFEANRDVIKDPDLIHPGHTIKIPAE